MTTGINNFIMLTRNALVNHDETLKASCCSLLLLSQQQFFINEFLSGNEFSDPSQSCLYWRGCVVDIIAVKAESHCQAQGIPCPEPHRLYTELSACPEDCLPELGSVSITDIYFASPGPCIALSLIHISEPTRLGMISYAVF